MNSQQHQDFGTRDSSGHWKPPNPAGFSPLFERPWSLLKVVRWLFQWGGYIFPMYVFYATLAWLSYSYLQPSMDTFNQLEFRWIMLILIRNLSLTIIVYGSYHFILYRWRLHGNKQKYNPKWQQTGSRKFLFGSQVWDNIFHTCVYGVPVWTAYEVVYLRLAAGGRLPLLNFSSNPVWFTAIFFIVPIWRESHFYFVHRLLHWKPLLRAVHSVHHRNPNPGPWSGLSMHPLEHVVYFSQLLIHFVIPAHPIHFLFNSQISGLSPSKGHIGFEGPLFNGLWPTGDYFHYLHHKHVSCNYGTPTIPWDRWLGRHYDGNGKYRTKG